MTEAVVLTKNDEIVHSVMDVQLPSILVVEDEPELETFFSHTIKEVNYRLDMVTSVEDALKQLNHRSYSLVIADHYLKGHQTGLDLWITCKKRWPHLPFLLTSAMGTEAFLKLTNGLQYVPPFLPKPFKYREFFDLISNLLKPEQKAKKPSFYLEGEDYVDHN